MPPDEKPSYSFPEGPCQDPPDESTLEKFDLKGCKPVICGICTVWATAVRNDEPVYAVFNRGTNYLVVLEKRAGDWRKVELQEVENLYGLVWRMTLKMK